jgi:hypothetical protein
VRPGNSFHDRCQELEPEVGIIKIPSGHSGAPEVRLIEGAVRKHQLADGRRLCAVGCFKKIIVSAAVAQARGVGEKVAYGDRPCRIRRVAQFKAEVASDIVVEIAPAAFDQLHNRGGHKRL